jgi:hypothetical protein
MRLRVHRASGIPHALNLFLGERITHHSGVNASRGREVVARVAARRANGSRERALDNRLRDEAIDLRIRGGDYGFASLAVAMMMQKADCVRGVFNRNANARRTLCRPRESEHP